MNRLISTLVFLVLMLSSNAQEKPLLTIGNEHITIEEFDYVYNKNNVLVNEPVSKADYLELFVNYKLKVTEAVAQGYDTVPSFINELDYYRNELAKPYLTDEKASEDVLKEAYDHMCYELDASHILINLPKSPGPEDTLKAYNRMADVKRQLDEGADFEQMVLKYSEGPSAKQSNGRLGYFTAFMMVYPFEKAAYNTPVGEVSPITRTSFGYHLIKIHDKRKNKGEVLVAHIMKAYPYKAHPTIQNQSKIAIDSIYLKLQNGASFDAMVAEYTDDKQSIAKNGQLPWFGTGKMVPEFSQAAFALSTNGEISAPVKTKFGWHIIKRLDARPIKSLEESRDDILQKIRRDERAFAGKKATIKRIKTENDFKLNTSDFAQLKELTLLHSKGDKSTLLEYLISAKLKPASFADVIISSEDFAHKAFSFNLPEEGLSEIDFQYVWDGYLENVIIEYEKSNLEKKYSEFKHLMNEYHDGLLIFEISQKEIWNKASLDSIGLNQYYQEHLDDYLLKEHFEGTLYYCRTKQAFKAIKKLLSKNSKLDNSSLPEELADQVMIKQGRFFKGDESLLDKQVWKTKTAITANDYPFLLKTGKRVDISVQPLEMIQGQVISDYQTELEKQWVNKLKEKYKPIINTFAL